MTTSMTGEDSSYDLCGRWCDVSTGSFVRGDKAVQCPKLGKDPCIYRWRYCIDYGPSSARRVTCSDHHLFARKEELYIKNTFRERRVSTPVRQRHRTVWRPSLATNCGPPTPTTPGSQKHSPKVIQKADNVQLVSRGALALGDLVIEILKALHAANLPPFEGPCCFRKRRPAGLTCDVDGFLDHKPQV